jgi:hypothetical protein
MSAKIEPFSDPQISLISHEMPAFEALLGARPIPDDLRNDLRDFSVFLANDSDQTIVGYSIRWEIGNQGIPRTISFVDQTWLSMPNLEPSKGALAPHSRRLISALQGGDAFAAQVDNPKFQNAITRSARRLRNQLKDGQDWRVSIDGIIFADGKFIGENKGRFFEITQAKVEADREFYRKLVADLDDGSSLNALLSERLAMAKAHEETRTEEALTPDWFYKKRQLALAEALIDAMDRFDEEYLIKAIRVENGKSRAVIYR